MGAQSNLKPYEEMDSLIEILRTGAVRLVKAEYIVHQFRDTVEPMPCLQDLPDEAFLRVEDLGEKGLAELRVFVLSYCWVTAEHPDPHRYHLESLALVLEVYLRCPRDAGKGEAFARNMRRNGNDIIGGQGRPVAAFWDWCALPQDKPRGRRTAEETAVFEQGLKSVNTWYAHSQTTVLALMSLPPEASRPSYADSGWTTFEWSVAGILTPAPRLLVVHKEARARIVEHRSEKPDAFLRLEQYLKDKARGAPRTPEAFERLIRTKTVTNGADVEKVLIPKYAETFKSVIVEAGVISMCGCELDTLSARETLRVARVACGRLRCLGLAGNTAMRLNLAEVAASCKDLEELNLEGCGEGARGDVASLSDLKALQRLHLRMTKVGGDVAGLSGLKALTHLDLVCTEVEGDVAGLADLKALEWLELSGPDIRGDVASLSDLKALDHLELIGGGVRGDVFGLLETLREARTST